MKYVLYILISVMLDTGKWSPPVETYVTYKTGYDCKDGDKAVRAVVNAIAAEGAKIRITTRCTER